MIQIIFAYLCFGVGFTGFFMDDFFEEVRKELDARLWYWPSWIIYLTLIFVVVAWPWFAYDIIKQIIAAYKARKILRALAKEFDKILEDRSEDEKESLKKASELIKKF